LKYLREAINDSQQELIIFSGWIAVWALNEIAVELRNALERNVSVSIGYGYDEKECQSKEKAEIEASALESLKSIERVSGGSKIRITRFPNHSKLVICDDKYAICGSANWLYNKDYSRKDSSVWWSDTNLVKAVKQDAIKDLLGK
jgi:phosphatidylserine/phosphatidylglycerophosphate/cardiolipin synthase-like enzyme